LGRSHCGMEARNLKQRVRPDADSEGGGAGVQVVVSDKYAGRPTPPPSFGAGLAGAGGRTYGAYPALQAGAAAAGAAGATDFSAVALDAGVEGLLRSRDAMITAVLTLLALVTRLYRIGRRPNVSWDEAHFGKFGAYYINGTFYHDVHPPLAKMLVALAEVVAGHNGSFRFSSGAAYPAHVNYTLMRMQMAMYGVALAPLAYLTCLHLHMSRPMAVLAACFVLFDNAICVMSRFILLDQPLLFFTALTLLSAAAFQHTSRHGRPYSRRWWAWLAMTGFSLGCVMSSKWVGLFCVIMVGVATVDDLFRKYCNRMDWEDIGMHWNARVVT
ncbi:Protein O-mannosyltransferase 2, partial [Coemansia helicoidea]